MSMPRWWGEMRMRPGITVHPGTASFRSMTPGSVALALGLKYAGLVGFGITAAIAVLPSLRAVGGDVLSLAWALSVILFALLSLIGVWRTWRTNRYRMEQYSSAALILACVFYSVAVLVRGMLLGDWGSIALAWLPVILMVFPTIRFYRLVVST
jgi:hypothetical protein